MNKILSGDRTDGNKDGFFISILLKGVGIGFLPERCAIPYIKTGQLLSYPYMFSDTLPKETIYAVYHKNNTAKIADLLEVMTQTGSGNLSTD